MKYLSALFVAFVAVQVVAQQPAPSATPAAATEIDGGAPAYLRPETAEQRAARVGPVDPGLNPDPKQAFYRYGKRYHIEKYDNRWVVMTGGDPGWARPYGFANIYKEIYQKNDKFTWFWFEDKDEAAQEIANAAATPSAAAPWSDLQLKYFKSVRAEFSPLTPQDSGRTVSFVESSEGLPKEGSWRNTLAIADMNGDGFADIIAPPERAGTNSPAIFLGDGKGHWKFWQGVKWPHGLNYGSVVAADFNKDGKMDLAFGVHLDGVHVFLGDGKGNFTDASDGLPRDYPTRRILVTDVDRDGYPDVVTISEGPTAIATSATNGNYAKLRVYLNRDGAKSWTGMNVAETTRQFGGDWLALGNFNGDAYPDFVAGSVYYGSSDILYLSNGAKKWNFGGDTEGVVVPALSYFFANTTGKFSSKKLDDAVVSYFRQWPSQLEANIVPKPAVENVVGIDRISFAGGKAKRTSIMRWDGKRPVAAMGTGDFDGDGNMDIVFLRYDPLEFVLLLGDGKGGFTLAKTTGLVPASNATYDLQVADVNGDGRPDIIIGYEAAGNTTLGARDGSIHVFLNTGVQPAKK